MIIIEGLSPKGGLMPNVRVYEGEGTYPIDLLWSTERGLDAQKTFIISVKYKGWYKGMTTTTGWSAARTQEIQANQLQASAPFPSSRYWWKHSLDIDGILREVSGGSWNYDNRIYDSIEFDFTVTSTFTDSFKEQYHQDRSETAFYKCWVGYIPKYRITDFYYETSDLLVIEYDTTWTRIDDRWCIEFLTDSYGDVVTPGLVWGSISELGRIELPVSKLSRHIKNKTVRLMVRFNATYRLPQASFSQAGWDDRCEDRSICNTPYLALVGEPTEYGVGVRIRTGDRGDLDAPIEQVTVKLRYGKYSFHQQTVAPGGIASFAECPLNTPLYFDAVGSRGKATSAMATIEVAPIKSDCGWVECLPSGEMIPLVWRTVSDDRGLSVRSSGNYEVVNLARRRPSAMWGRGGATHVSLTRAFLREYDGLSYVDQLEAFPEYGEMVIRDPDGHVYAIAGEVDITNPARDYWKVTISGDEVDA